VGYLAAWKVLEEMITDFRKKKVSVPAEVISNLRYARTLINVLKADPSHLETGQKVEGLLFSVESHLVSEGQKKFGTEYVEDWLQRLDEASRQAVDEVEEETRFVSGIPRGQKWIRVKPSIELPVEVLKALADESNVICSMQRDGLLLVYGEEGCIRIFVKKMTAKFGSKDEG